MLVGGVVNGIFSLFIRWSFFQPYVANGQWGEFLAGILWMVFLGFTMSVIAQAGFFAYLTLHQVGVNIFRTLTLWNWVQLLLILITIFDIVFFRFVPGVKDGQSWLFYLGLLIVLIFASIATAVQKVKMTGKKHVLVSALFFMIVVTTLEWTIALMGRDENINEYVALLLFPLLAVNAYQLLVLPKYNAKSDEDRKKLEERRKARLNQAKNA
jgi:KinB signaling pathway activation protein